MQKALEFTENIVQSSNFNTSRRLGQSSFAVLWINLLAMGLGAFAWTGQAQAWTGQPLAYVTSKDGISVIDTGDNRIVDTIPSCSTAAVTPDGKHVYAFGPSTSDFEFNIFVIDATNDKVVAKVPLDVTRVSGGESLNDRSKATAITPDGKYVFAITGLCSSNSFDCFRHEAIYYAFWVIDTATNKVVEASPGKGISDGIAFTPDGKHTYFTNFDPGFSFTPLVLADTGEIQLSENGSDYAIAITPDGKRLYVPFVSINGNIAPEEIVGVIDTATNTLAHTIPIEPALYTTTLTGIAVMPDGKHVYVSNQGGNGVAVIETASNTVAQTIVVGAGPGGVAVTPDGKRVYVSNENRVSVINTATKTVEATIAVAGPGAIAIVAPPLAVPFLSFDARLNIHLADSPNQDAFGLWATFMLSGGIHPDQEPVKLQVGPFTATIPSGSFKPHEDGRSYTFEGVIDGVHLEARIEARGGFSYAFHVSAQGANFSGTTNPVQVSLGIGDNAGLTSVTAHFDRDNETLESSRD